MFDLSRLIESIIIEIAVRAFYFLLTIFGMCTTDNKAVVGVYKGIDAVSCNEFYIRIGSEENIITIVFLGWSTNGKQDTIYYKAETKKCTIKNNEISFNFLEDELPAHFTFSKKPFKINSLDDFTEDKTIEAGLAY